jgi:hypothetical protein
MGCDVPVRECLAVHIRPHLLPGAGEIRIDAETNLPTFTARCPAHGDQKPSLSISAGKYKRVVCNCHAGCTDSKIRHALIDAGVNHGCLPRSAAEMRDFEETLRALLTSDLSHADVRLRALALLDSPRGELPKGGALIELAAQVHVSRSGAFGARGRGGLPKTTQ